jgi:signal transduction histidine kinase/CheY-like chemotaxis protein
MSLRLLRLSLETDDDLVLARQRSRQIACRLGFGSQDQTRIATAVSEIARNAIEHGAGGEAEFLLIGTSMPQLLQVVVRDRGLQRRASPSPIAGMPGLGIGLAGAERLVDRFRVEPAPGGGTVVTLARLIPESAGIINPARVREVAEQLARENTKGVLDELKRQNRELLASLEEARHQHERLVELNRELDDTNRGVLALYAELDEKAEHLKRADELKTRFLSNMTHEFRTPLNSILALCRFLDGRSDGPLTLEQARQVSYIQKSAESLSELVEDLLDLAKVAAGKTVIRPADFRIADLFGALRGMLRPLLASSRVDLIFENVDALPSIYGDESKVSQIVRNFISNALKFTEQGEVRVGATLDDEHGMVTIWVRDTGIGIAPEHHARIFEEFSQVDSHIQRKVKGTGLGLPLAKQLADLLKGKVSLESAPGRGSTFAVTLPLRFEKVAAFDPAELVGVDPDRIPVLAIEDNPADMAVLESMLRRSPYQLIKAESFPEARRALVGAQPRVVLLDIVIGNEQSWKLLSEIKRSPETAHVSVVVVSSAGDPAKAMALGADTVLQKPVSATTLLATLDGLVGSSRRSRVLIVDDDDISRYVIRQYLSGCGAVVLEAESGASGVEAAAHFLPDLVLLDINMPDRDGYAVLADLGSDPRTARTPVAIVTSSVLGKEDEERLSHARAVLRKNELSSDVLKRLLASTVEQGRVA